MNAISRTLCIGALTVCSTLVLISDRTAPAVGASSPSAAVTPIAPQTIFAAGIVEPISGERDVASAVTGQITRMLVDTGDRVTTGQVIAEIQNQDRKAELAAADAQLEMAKAELARLVAGARREEKDTAKAELRSAEAALQLAQKRLEQVSKDGGDRAHSDYEAALARRDFLAQRLALITAPPRSEDLEIENAKVTAAEANVRSAQARLDMTLIRSPIDGVVLKRYKLAGETVSAMPPTVIAIIGDTSHLRVRAQIDERDVGKIALGERATVSADAFGHRRFEGMVARIGSRLGIKDLNTDRPDDRVDSKILEALVTFNQDPPFPVGLRVDVSFDTSTGAAVANAAAPAAELPQQQSAQLSETPAEPTLPPPPPVSIDPPKPGAISSETPLGEPQRTGISQLGVPPGTHDAALPERPGALAAAEATSRADTHDQTAAAIAVPSHAEEPADEYTLQFASCSTEKCAHDISDTLNGRGVSAGVVQSRDRAGREWFTVRAGTYKDAAAASAAADALKDVRDVPPLIVIRGHGPA